MGQWSRFTQCLCQVVLISSNCCFGTGRYGMDTIKWTSDSLPCNIEPYCRRVTDLKAPASNSAALVGNKNSSVDKWYETSFNPRNPFFRNKLLWKMTNTLASQG